jgi:hypothetical protein
VLAARYRLPAVHNDPLFGLSVLTSFVVFGIVAKLYIAPRLNAMRREDALGCLVAPHMFRFVGLSFLVPGVVSPALSSAFAAPAAYGDMIAALLAIVSTIALAARATWATALVWLFNIWGTGDLLYAFYQGLIGAAIDPAPPPARRSPRPTPRRASPSSA